MKTHSATQNPDDTEITRLMTDRTGSRIALSFWILAFLAVPIWIYFDTAGWDTSVYITAVHSLRTGHDPYADAIAVQKLFHEHAADRLNQPLPYSYVYSPITLPLLRVFGAVPLWLGAGFYLLLYIAGVLAQIWFGMQAVRPPERFLFRCLAPIAAFCPGFLANANLESGNVAYIIYGATLLGTFYGWRKNRWLWFYLVVMIGSCFKAPMLSLLTIPVLSARGQWRSAGISLVAGLALFAVQPLLWPTLFHHYLQAVELQFSYNQDFGSSPTGLFSSMLSTRGMPYSPACLIFYAAYAIPLFASLLILSRKFLAGCFSLQHWAPVLLLGVLLLNPRLIEYDLAPLTIPIALIAWRFFGELVRPPIDTVLLAVLFIALNAVALQGWNDWKLVAGPLLVTSYIAGSWTLLKRSGSRADDVEVIDRPESSTRQNLATA